MRNRDFLKILYLLGDSENPDDFNKVRTLSRLHDGILLGVEGLRRNIALISPLHCQPFRSKPAAWRGTARLDLYELIVPAE